MTSCWQNNRQCNLVNKSSFSFHFKPNNNYKKNQLRKKRGLFFLDISMGFFLYVGLNFYCNNLYETHHFFFSTIILSILTTMYKIFLYHQRINKYFMHIINYIFAIVCFKQVVCPKQKCRRKAINTYKKNLPHAFRCDRI